MSSTERLFRVGGLSTEELQIAASSLKEQGGLVELADVRPFDKRFNTHEEHTIRANSEGVLGLLRDGRVSIAVCPQAEFLK